MKTKVSGTVDSSEDMKNKYIYFYMRFNDLMSSIKLLHFNRDWNINSFDK